MARTPPPYPCGRWAGPSGIGCPLALSHRAVRPLPLHAPPTVNSGLFLLRHPFCLYTTKQGLDPLSEVVLACKHNGRLLQPDHGYPLRVVIPGALLFACCVVLCCAATHDIVHHPGPCAMPPRAALHATALCGWDAWRTCTTC